MSNRTEWMLKPEFMQFAAFPQVISDDKMTNCSDSADCTDELKFYCIQTNL